MTDMPTAEQQVAVRKWLAAGNFMETPAVSALAASALAWIEGLEAERDAAVAEAAAKGEALNRMVYQRHTQFGGRDRWFCKLCSARGAMGREKVQHDEDCPLNPQSPSPAVERLLAPAHRVEAEDALTIHDLGCAQCHDANLMLRPGLRRCAEGRNLCEEAWHARAAYRATMENK